MVFEPFSTVGSAKILYCEKSMSALAYWRIFQNLRPTTEKLVSTEEMMLFCNDHKTWLENKSYQNNFLIWAESNFVFN